MRRVSVGPLDNNAYLMVDGDQALLVDAAAEPDTLLALARGVRIATIVTTHRHLDHVGALAEVADAAGARLVAGAPDAAAIEQATGVSVDRRVWDGDRVRVGGVEVEVIGLVGHTPGSIALVYEPADGPVELFVGDALFPGGVGKTGSDADFTRLFTEVTTKLFDRFPDDTVVWPGHGLPTTLGTERPHLPQWWARRW